MSRIRTLKQAITARRVAALHIDMQEKFLDPYDLDILRAIKRINQLAPQLRKSSIKNHWVAFASMGTVSSCEKYNKDCEDNDQNNRRLSSELSYDPQELVFQKQTLGSFDRDETPLYLRLKADSVSALIVTGIFYHACVFETVLGAARNNMDVFTVIDATDCPKRYVNSWKRDLDMDLPLQSHRKRIRVIQSAELMTLIS